MSDEIDELRSEIAELKSELADIKFSLQNRTFEPLGVSKQNSSFDSMFKNFGQTAGKLFFGNENTMTKGLMSSFNSFTNHYNKITAKNQFSFIGQRFAGGNAVNCRVQHSNRCSLALPSYISCATASRK